MHECSERSPGFAVTHRSMRRRLLVAVTGLLCLLSLGSAADSHASDWPQFLGPDRNGILAEVDRRVSLESNAKPAWTAEVGTGYSSVSVANGKLYTMGHAGGKESVHCLDAKTGRVIWSKGYPAQLINRLHQGGPSSTPTVDGDRLYTLGKDGKFICWDAGSGKEHWRIDLVNDHGRRVPQWGMCASPLIEGDWVVIDAGPVMAFNKKTGKLAWKSRDYKPAYSSVVAFDHKGKRCMATLNSDGLLVIDGKNGKTLAFTPWKTKYDTNATTPLIVGDLIYVSTGYGRGNALFQFTGNGLQKKWENTKLSNHMNNSVLVDGFLYGFDGNGHRGGPEQRIFLVCLSLQTGEELWRTKGYGCGSVIAAGKTLIVLSDTGVLATVEASPKGHKEIARTKVVGPSRRFTSKNPCWTHPVLAHGVIYARDAQGNLAAVEVGK